MWIYLLLGPPLAYLLMVWWDDDPDSTGRLGAMLRGLLVWLTGIVGFLFLAPLVEIRYTPQRLYLYYLFRDFGYWTLLGILGYVVFYVLPADDGRRRTSGEVGAYALALFLPAPIVDLIDFRMVLNPYHLFLLPSLRIAVIFAFTGLVSAMDDTAPVFRTLSFAGTLSVALLAACVPMLYVTNRTVAACLVCGAIVAGLVSGFVLTKRARVGSRYLRRG